jgi:hypothetical protein
MKRNSKIDINLETLNGKKKEERNIKKYIFREINTGRP